MQISQPSWHQVNRPIRCWLGKIILILGGWQQQHCFPPNAPKMVFIAAPHTSNWDFLWMLACAWRNQLNIHWIGKKELFRGHFMRRLMTWLGGIPVDRDKRNNTVSRAAHTIRLSEKICLMIPPEGTRHKKHSGWHTGFYYIAQTANVPICFGFLDYAQRSCGVGGYIYPSGNIAQDFSAIKAFYDARCGLYPNKQSQCTLAGQVVDSESKADDEL